jgi:hypothetical protein
MVLSNQNQGALQHVNLTSQHCIIWCRPRRTRGARLVPLERRDCVAQAAQLYAADANNFLVNSLILTGEKEALLVDTQLSCAHANRLVANLLAAGKQLATVYITHCIPIITSESR